jgi:hypothetical protein
VRDVYDKLLKAKDTHVLITVTTAHRDYRNMMITRLAAPRTTAEGTSSKFQIDFKQIRIASSQSVAAPKPAEPRAQPVSNNGKQGAKPAPDAEKKQSILYGQIHGRGGP